MLIFFFFFFGQFNSQALGTEPKRVVVEVDALMQASGSKTVWNGGQGFGDEVDRYRTTFRGLYIVEVESVD